MPWSACSHVLEERWRGAQLQAHRERLEAIRSAACVSTDVLSAALSGATSPVRVLRPATARGSAAPTASAAARPAPLPKSKSPAAKSRQRQIERDNLALIHRLLALDSRTRTPKAGAKPRPSSAHSAAAPRRVPPPATDDLLDLSGALTARDHACAPRPGAPWSAASHALYTRRSAGAHVGFCEQNAPALDRRAGTARRRSTAQRRILDENKRLLERILAARTTVSRADWQRHEQQHRRLLGSISRHGALGRAEGQERLARAKSGASLLCGRDDVVTLGGGGGSGQTAAFRSSSGRRSRQLAVSSSMPALPEDHLARSSGSVVARLRRMVIEADAEGPHSRLSHAPPEDNEQ